MEERKGYSDEELEEFHAIICEKLSSTRRDYTSMVKRIMDSDGNDTDDTSPTYKTLEESSTTRTKEELVQMANRQRRFIQGLEAALVQTNNKTYGVDRMAGELIPEERLKAMPHVTLSVVLKKARDH